MASIGSSSSAATEPAVAIDYVVALPTFNQARAIASTVNAARDVLGSQFLGRTGGIVIADVGSTDDTIAAARAAAGDTGNVEVVTLPGQSSEIIGLPYHGLPGRSRALRGALEAAQQAGARAVAVIDATAPETRERITRLLHPVLTAPYDFAAPVYGGRPLGGILVKGIIRPLFQTCFGLRLRHPLGPEFACSGRLIAHLLQSRVWASEVGDADVDLWLAASAAAESFEVCQVALPARGTGSRDDSPDLADTLAQVVGALFREMDRRAAVWQRVRMSKTVPTFESLPPAAVPVAIDVRGPLDAFRLGCRELSDVWAEILPTTTILDLRRLAAASESAFRMPDRLWARILADFAVGYRQRVIARDHLLRALTPAYLGWTASLTLECGAWSADAVDARIETLCENFELEKPYLISRWRWPERFRPR